MRRVWLWMVPVLALAGAGGFYIWQPAGGSAADVPYRLAAVERGAITASVRATGTLSAVTTVLVGSQLSGQVVEILADYNSPVKAGQVIARIYAEQIKSRRDAARADLEQARADLLVRRAQAEKSRAALQRSQAIAVDLQAQRDKVLAQLAEAERNLERQTELNARNVGAQSTLDQARTQVEVQRAVLASAEAQITSNKAEALGLQADISLAAAQVAAGEAVILQREARVRDIEIDLSRTEIRSPVDGVVVKRDVELGQTVAASLSAPTLFTIAQDLREIDIYANIDEADVGRVKEGQAVTFSVNAYPNRTFNGNVRMVRLSAQTIQNVVTYTAVIGVENGDQALLPGMTANLQIVTEERRNVRRVPNAALRFRPVVGAASSVIPAAPAANFSEPQRSPRSLQDFRERLVAEVQPTPEQTAAIDRILTEMRPAVREPGMSDGERPDNPRRFRQEAQRRIAEVLDPDRRAKLLAITQENRRGRDAPPPDAGVPGRAYVLDDQQKPAPVALRIGITDGSYTEIVAGPLEEGAAVVIGGGPRGPAAEGPPTPANSPTSRARGPRLF